MFTDTYLLGYCDCSLGGRYSFNLSGPPFPLLMGQGLPHLALKVYCCPFLPQAVSSGVPIPPPRLVHTRFYRSKFFGEDTTYC